MRKGPEARERLHGEELCSPAARKEDGVLWGPMGVGVYHRLGNTWVTDQGFGDNILEEVSGPASCRTIRR